MALMSNTRGGGMQCTKWRVFLAVAVFIVLLLLYVEHKGTDESTVLMKFTRSDGDTNGEYKGYQSQNWLNSVGAAMRSVDFSEKTTSNGQRRFEIKEPSVISDVSKTLGKSVPSGTPLEDAGYSEEMQHFVKAGRFGLTVDNKPFFVNGFNNYYIVTRAAWIGEGRSQVDEVFQGAQRLGSNTLRIWGFCDGDDWNALQPQLGVIDENVFREGLDYVVAKAHQYGLRLLITLTNYWDAYGGMPQYLSWVNKNNITEFYTDKDVKSNFKDYVYTVINRVNTWDGVVYRDNPSILGWEIANEPKDPGNPGSEALQGWIQEMSEYVKSLDPNHIVMVGTEGFFGPSTSDPDRLSSNPYTQNFGALSTELYRYDAWCEGQDFEANHQVDAIDVSVVHLYPDHWTGCEDECKLDFARKWIRHHLMASAELGRPLLIGEYGGLKPMLKRNEILRVIHDEMVNAAKKTYPVAGTLAWMLVSSNYPDYDLFGIYTNKTAATMIRPPATPHDFEKEATRATLYNVDASLKCMDNRAESLGWNEGWEDTMNLWDEYAKELQALSNYSRPNE